jgi:alanine-glyoxylate transaminase/serine-glyoxylate transaminase/serine-pyruvate transaminase
MDAFLVVDAVASLGGTPLPVDELGIDICYSGSQKCLSAPPGLAPITMSDRTLDAIERRRTPVPSWYLDLSLHARYWDSEHIYHHTGPVLNLYALHEALRVILEEGLEARFARHRVHARAVWAGLEALELRLFADAAHRLVPVATVLVPEELDAGTVRAALLEEYSLEIAGGLDAYAGRMWRIGIMGHSASQANVMLLLGALEQILRRLGSERGSAQTAADAVYRSTQQQLQEHTRVRRSRPHLA